jgi:hypothetical protein
MVTQESALGGDRFSAFNSTVIGNGASAYNNSCAPDGDCSTAAGNNFWDNAHTFDSSNRGERLGGEPNTLMQRAQRAGGSSNG